MKMQVPVICGYAHRIDRDYQFELGISEVIYPEDWATRRDPLYYITARYTRAIENMIRMRPEQYFWMHRRWKSRPAFERNRRPMPQSLRRNLEDLPWMDDQLMATINTATA